MIYTQKMTVDQWIAMADNPRQRDTARRAATATHLKKPSPVHAAVAAAKMPDGSLVKLDGHTRALLWQRNEVERPKMLEVTIIPVKSLDEARVYYTQFDGEAAVEKASDRVFGAISELGFEPQSNLLKSCRISAALRIAMVGVRGWSAHMNKGIETYEAVQEFAAEILALDDLRLQSSSATTGIIAAFILTYRRHGDRVMSFWRAVFTNGGTKIEGEMDGIQALVEFMAQKKSVGTNGRGFDACARALTACEKYLAGESLRSGLRAMDVAKYLPKKTSQQHSLAMGKVK